MDDDSQIHEMEKDMARDAEEIRLLKGHMIELEAALIQESLRVDWLLARQYNHKTRESVDAEIFACGDCDPCLGGRPDQCALFPSPLPSAIMFGNASKLRDAQAYLQNATSGLILRGENQSPLLNDLVACDRLVEVVRQWLLSPNPKQ